MRRLILLSSLLLVHLILIIGSQVVAVFPSQAPYTSGHFAAFAVVVCQSAIAAICAVLAPGPARRRMLMAVALSVSVWAAFTACLAVGLTAGRAPFPVAASGVAVVVLASFCVSALLLRLFQMAAAWRIVDTQVHWDAGSDHGPASPRVRQFRIVELWTATVVVALLVWCAVAAAARTSDELNPAYVASFGFVIVWQTLQMPLAIWAALGAISPARAMRRLGVLLPVTLAAAAVSKTIGWFLSDLPSDGYFAAAIIYSSVLFVSLYVVRMAGFRLVGLPCRFPDSI